MIPEANQIKLTVTQTRTSELGFFPAEYVNIMYQLMANISQPK